MAVTSVAQYLEALTPEDRAVINKVRALVNKRLPKGYEEGIQYGMIGWFVPKSLYEKGYHSNPKEPLPYLGLARKKAYFALHFITLYTVPEELERFTATWKESGKKLDMGAGCLRFKKFDDLATDAVGDAVAALPVKKWVAAYEARLKKR